MALEAGYSSHEAFTRAFRDRFGVTPEPVRAERQLNNLNLVEPIKMDESLLKNLEPPRFEGRARMFIVGLSDHYDCDTSKAIPSQWQRFQPHIGNIPHLVGRTAFGVSCHFAGHDEFDYLCGVEVSRDSEPPPGLSRLRVPARRYAVFSHRDHISTIRKTFTSIWSQWLPESGLKVSNAPSFELYEETFDPNRGTGGVEIWIPIEA